MAIFEPGILPESEDGLDQPLPIALAETVTFPAGIIDVLQQKVFDEGAEHRGQYYWLRLADEHLNRKLFGAMLGRICRLPLPRG